MARHLLRILLCALAFFWVGEGGRVSFEVIEFAFEFLPHSLFGRMTNILLTLLTKI